jgi:hypothetical protein
MIQKVSNLISDFNGDKVACIFGRESGRHFFTVVEHLLRDVPDNVTIYLSFEGVSFDYTFADEALVKLASHIAQGAFSFKYLVLTDLSDNALENLMVALDRKWLSERPRRDLVLPVKTSSGLIEPVGHLQNFLKELYLAVRNRHCGEFGTKDIMVDMNMSLTKASEYLKRLNTLKLVKRYERYKQGGRTFWYTRLEIQPSGEPKPDRRHYYYSEADPTGYIEQPFGASSLAGNVFCS